MFSSLQSVCMVVLPGVVPSQGVDSRAHGVERQGLEKKSFEAENTFVFRLSWCFDF